MLGIQYHHRRERQNAGQKIFPALLALAGRQFRRRQDAHACLCKFALQLYVGGIAVAVSLCRHRGNSRKLFRRGQFRLVVDCVRSGNAVVVQTAHAHHKKFVEIGTEDGQKFTPLQQRVGKVVRLVEHPLVKQKP